MKHPDKPFAMVIWDDAHGNSSDDYSEEELLKKHKGARYYSYGWLILSNEIGIRLVSEWQPEEKSYRATMFIPRGMVVEEQILVLAKPRRKRASKSLVASTITP